MWCDQVMLVVMFVLTATVYALTISHDLPSLGYLTWMDKYVLATFLFASIVALSIVGEHQHMCWSQSATSVVGVFLCASSSGCLGGWTTVERQTYQVVRTQLKKYHRLTSQSVSSVLSWCSSFIMVGIPAALIFELIHSAPPTHFVCNWHILRTFGPKYTKFEWELLNESLVSHRRKLANHSASKGYGMIPFAHMHVSFVRAQSWICSTPTTHTTARQERGRSCCGLFPKAISFTPLTRPWQHLAAAISPICPTTSMWQCAHRHGTYLPDTDARAHGIVGMCACSLCRALMCTSSH